METTIYCTYMHQAIASNVLPSLSYLQRGALYIALRVTLTKTTSQEYPTVKRGFSHAYLKNLLGSRSKPWDVRRANASNYKALHYHTMRFIMWTGATPRQGPLGINDEQPLSAIVSPVSSTRKKLIDVSGIR